MNRKIRRTRRGFSLVELLAVVLVLAVLSGVAVPIYLNTRKDSAARACKANIAAIAAAQSAFATRFGAYDSDPSGSKATEAAYNQATPSSGGLVGAPEGLTKNLFCPLDGTGHYSCTVASGVLTITCANAAAHATATGAAASNWTITLQPAGLDTTNPL